MPFPIDHDLHCHSVLSSCSGNEKQTVQTILAHAKQHGYTVQCITDHLWDPKVPGASDWYAPQDIDHVRQSLPLPDGDGVRLIFGCETEYCGGEKLGLSAENYDLFDFIVIPPNHFHMKGLVRPHEYVTEEMVADLLVERLEQLSELDLPWKKVGIAHLNCGLTFSEGSPERVFALVDEKRYRAVMKKFAALGAGIELNLACFKPNWREHEEEKLRLFRMAKEEGCKFYLASDAHTPEELVVVHERGELVCSLLGLDECDQFILG